MIYLIKNYFKGLLYIIIIIISLTIILTLFNYFGIVKGGLFTILKLLIPIFSIIYASLMIGKKARQKGYIEGIKFGIITIMMLVILNFIFGNNFEWKNIIYYLILLLFSTLGSMIGINKKKTD